MISCQEATELIKNGKVAFDKDFTIELAESISCKFDDDEVLQFWDFIVPEIRRQNDNSSCRTLNSWFVSLINRLSEETVEFLAEGPNPLKDENYPYFEPGDLVEPLVRLRRPIVNPDKSKREYGWGLHRGIWVKDVPSEHPNFIDLDEDNTWRPNWWARESFKNKAHDRLSQGMSRTKKGYSEWSRNELQILEKKKWGSNVHYLDEGVWTFMNERQISNEEYQEWLRSVTPPELLRHPVGLVVEKRFVPHSIHKIMSDTWFYLVTWVDHNGDPIQGWHAWMSNKLMPAKTENILDSGDIWVK